MVVGAMPAGSWGLQTPAHLVRDYKLHITDFIPIDNQFFIKLVMFALLLNPQRSESRTTAGFGATLPYE